MDIVSGLMSGDTGLPNSMSYSDIKIAPPVYKHEISNILEQN